jgi:hypothetical protein
MSYCINITMLFMTGILACTTTVCAQSPLPKNLLTPTLWFVGLALDLESALGDSPHNTSAQPEALPDESRYTSFLFPRNPDPWQFSIAADASITILPRLIVEESVRTIPMLGVNVRMGLPLNFGMQARLRSILLSNVVLLGASWSYSLDRLSLAIHNNAGAWAGFAGILEGFDSYAWGLLTLPGLSVGVHIGASTLLSARLETTFAFGYNLTVGSTRIVRRTSAFRGLEGTVCLEQSIKSGGRIFAGFRAAYSRPSYEIWAAFSDIESFLFYPTIMLGYAF